MSAPATLATAMAAPTCHQTWPVLAKSPSADRLVAMFSTLALAEACRKSWPSTRTKRKTKKLPVPGPKNPS